VALTIDLPLQEATARALRNALPETRGAAVVMDCWTGDILAMSSVPTFDPGLFTGRISEEQWAQLSDEKLTPQLNRATYGTYLPGSIFKIVVALACLEAGTIQTSEVFESKGYYQVNGRGHIWGDTAGPGHFDFWRAFYLSSNPYFQDHGVRLGFEKVVEMGRRLGLGRRTGLATRQEAAGYFPYPLDKIKRDGSRWMPGDTANLSIGQGEISVTPLQMAVMTAAIANGGKLLEPRLIDRIEPQDPDAAQETVRFPQGQIRADLRLAPRNLDIVRRGMLMDVEHKDEVTGRYGTGHPAAVEGLRVCGKTGTAQVMDGRHLKEYVTWFVSFAPYDNPRYTVVVVIEGGASGTWTCAPVAHDIYQAIVHREQEGKAEAALALN
jgi:penicillin-binding protein 2